MTRLAFDTQEQAVDSSGIIAAEGGHGTFVGGVIMR